MPGVVFGAILEAHMEKVVLLCLLMAIITVLAEMSPVPQPERSPAPKARQ
jgi:hypothetical protein